MNIITLFLVLYITHINVNANVDVSPFEDVIGRGYVSDNNIVAPNVCFSVTEVSHSFPVTTFYNSSPITIRELISQLKIDVVTFRAFSVFKANRLFHYLDRIKEHECADSFIFVSSSIKDVMVKYDKEHVLNTKGEDVYRNDSKNFRLLCGDYLIDRYYIGAALIYTVKITYDTVSNAKLFKKYFNPSIDNFITDVQKAMTQSGVKFDKGYLDFEVFEINGDTHGSFPGMKSLRCNLNNLEVCREDFKDYFMIMKQYDPRNHNNTMLYLAERDIPVDIYGVHVSETLVDKRVREMRNALIRTFSNLNQMRNKFEYMIQMHSIKSSEIIDMKMFLDHNLNEYYHNKTILNCYNDVTNILSCGVEILNAINPFKDKLADFNGRFSMIYTTKVNLTEKAMLPSNMKWNSNDDIIHFAFYFDEKNKYYPFFYSRFSKLICHDVYIKDDVYYFTLSDGVIDFECKIGMDEELLALLVCTNNYFSNQYIWSQRLTQQPNPFTIDYFDW